MRVLASDVESVALRRIEVAALHGGNRAVHNTGAKLRLVLQHGDDIGDEVLTAIGCERLRGEQNSVKLFAGETAGHAADSVAMVARAVPLTLRLASFQPTCGALRF